MMLSAWPTKEFNNEYELKLVIAVRKLNSDEFEMKWPIWKLVSHMRIMNKLAYKIGS